MAAQFVLRLLSSQFPAAWPDPTPDHYVVLWGTRVVGSVNRNQGGPQDHRWQWSITWPPAGVHKVSGIEEDRRAAMAAFKAAWPRWCKLHEVNPDPDHPSHGQWPEPRARRI